MNHIYLPSKLFEQVAQTNLDKLIILQNALYLFNSLCSIQISCDPIIQPLANVYNILPLKGFQYCKSVGTILHDVSKNCLPENISNPFLEPTQGYSYNTSLVFRDW